MGSSVRQWFSFADYVRLDEEAGCKHEFLGGAVWAMAGGSPEHAAVAGAVVASLTVALRGQPCRVFTSDLRIRVKATGLGTYPDVSVVCGGLALDPDDPRGHTVVNPVVVVEVLSPSTEDYDRGEKSEHYRQIESLKQLVLVCPRTKSIEVSSRAANWSSQVYREGEVALASLGIGLDLEALFEDPLAQS